MSDPGLSSTAKSLLSAAKADGPSAAARAKIWGGVVSGGIAAGASGAGAGAAANAGAGAVVAGGSGKLLAMGALFGSTLTVGIAATLIGIGASTPVLRPEPPQPREAIHVPVTASPGFGAQRMVPASRGALPTGEALGSVRDGAGGASATNGARANGASTVSTHTVHEVAEDTLMRESALVAEARGALLRGDPDKALALLRVAKTLKLRALEPEELSLEAKALRASGKEDAARDAESALRARFPDHALAR